MASRFSALVEHEVPAVAEAQHAERAVVDEVAADLLGKADADMLGDRLGPPRMRRDLGDRLEDQVEVADRHAFGEQELQGREHAALRDLRRANIVEQALVFGFEPIDSARMSLYDRSWARLLWMTSERWVSSTETGSIGLKPCAPRLLDEGFGDGDGPDAEGGLAHLFAGQVGFRTVAEDDEPLARPEFVGRHRRAVNFDLIGLGGRLDVVAQPDLRDDETVLAGELAPHLGDARGDLLAREDERGVQLLRQHELDLEALELLLDRGALLGFAPAPPSPPVRRLLGASRAMRRGIATPTNAMSPPSIAKGRNGRPGTTPSTAISSAATNSAFG